MKKYNHRFIGSISSGTMRPEDLIPTFMAELAAMRPLAVAHRGLLSDIRRRINADWYYTSDSAMYDLDSLFDALDEYSLPYFSFGAHPGDGSDYGWWLPEGFVDDFQDDGGLVVSDMADVPRTHYGEYLLVSDHGNVSLMTRLRNNRTVNVWSIV